MNLEIKSVNCNYARFLGREVNYSFKKILRIIFYLRDAAFGRRYCSAWSIVASICGNKLIIIPFLIGRTDRINSNVNCIFDVKYFCTAVETAV